MVGSAEFWDRAAAKYVKSPIKDMDAYEQTLERTRSYLGAEDSVLEIGCGTGMTATKLAPSVARYLATDISPNMVDLGRDRLMQGALDGLSFDVGTAFEGSHIGQTYDAVLAFNFIHLADDPQAMIDASFVLLKPGGTFISKSACMADWYKIIRPIIGFMKLIGKAPHLAWFGREDLVGMMRKAGFEVVETHDFSVSPPSHFVVARRPA